ncbi:Acetyltransferase (GNAT) family [Teratosphaeria destructans]|uniref:Acetyltransferase (GNAT) family n=1 Tax=Teratosphaeria destructans TaxID=418781 RepID=A0A9W7SLI0_9PEZI|nr:Acetyltransferase (GNAT) family [Teratosphaeria destructans]
MTGSVASLPPPSPLSHAVDSVMGDDEQLDAPVPPADPLEGVPELTTYKPTDTEERIDALNLVADSIAQQRQTANNHLISHPLNLAAVVAVVAIAARYMWDTYHDYYYTGMTGVGLVMVFFASLRYATKDYLFAAEDITWDWLGDGEIIITKFGREVIGALVIDWVSGESRQKRKRAWRGEIKGWTVKLRYRQKGVGTALLEEGIREAKQKGAETIEFAEDHASKSETSQRQVRRLGGRGWQHPANSRPTRFQAIPASHVQWSLQSPGEVGSRQAARAARVDASEEKEVAGQSSLAHWIDQVYHACGLFHVKEAVNRARIAIRQTRQTPSQQDMPKVFQLRKGDVRLPRLDYTQTGLQTRACDSDVGRPHPGPAI